jgi:ATP/maltotriose-dependent transcriptional regulator MalT
MESSVGSAAVAGGAARPGVEGIVSRPRLFGRLAGPARVTVVSAPPGSGKTVLLRSWISDAGLDERAAWVPAGRGERDPQRFWLAVLAALRQTGPGAVLVQPLTAAPDLDGWAITERLLTDLAPLQDRAWLVVDDVHELGAEALRQLELLIMRAPPSLRFVLATRHDMRLGLHRLRLEGELAEIREPDLRFTVAEAEQLFGAAGVRLPGLGLMVERTEGWAAGLRLTALSLAGHPDPGRFAEQFAGTERTVADYLLAEVLDRQSPEVRRLPRSRRYWTDPLPYSSEPGWLTRSCWRRSPETRSATRPPANQALERALDLAEPDGALLWFLLHPVPGLLERHARHRTAHAALIAEILSLLAGQTPAPPAGPQPPLEPLSSSEIRVLRYLPTNLTMPEIAGELYVSHNTVRTHMRHLYAKLRSHRRAEAVARARDLGLLAPSALRR